MVDEDKDRGIVPAHITPLNGPPEHLMRPLTCLAGESARIKGHADVAQCRVIVPVRSVVVPLVTTISKGAKWNKRADRGAEVGAFCHVAGTAVKVAHC